MTPAQARSIRKGRVKKVNDFIRESAEKVVVTGSRLFHDNLVDRTPVDTTRAKRGWRRTIGMPRAESKETNVSTLHGRQITALIASNKWKWANAAIRITNDVPYIGLLNKGHSKQAPAKFVEQALLDAYQRFVP